MLFHNAIAELRKSAAVAGDAKGEGAARSSATPTLCKAQRRGEDLFEHGAFGLAAGPAAALFAALMLFAPVAQAAEKPIVVVSVLPQVFFVKQIAGDLVRVEALIPPGLAPDSYEPTLGQLKSISKAALYIKVGHPGIPLEQTWLKHLLAEGSAIELIDSSEGLPYLPDDPHVWVTPDYGRSMTRNITRALIRLLPEHRAELEHNQNSLLESIDQLDAEIRQLLEPYAGQKFLVFHPAWGYFAQKYHLEQLAVEAHGKEPSPAELTRLIELARKNNLKTIFVQPQFSRAEAQTLARDIGAKLVWMDPLAEDWLENLRQTALALQKALSA